MPGAGAETVALAVVVPDDHENVSPFVVSPVILQVPTVSSKPVLLMVPVPLRARNVSGLFVNSLDTDVSSKLKSSMLQKPELGR